MISSLSSNPGLSLPVIRSKRGHTPKPEDIEMHQRSGMSLAESLAAEHQSAAASIAAAAFAAAETRQTAIQAFLTQPALEDAPDDWDLTNPQTLLYLLILGDSEYKGVVLDWLAHQASQETTLDIWGKWYQYFSVPGGEGRALQDMGRMTTLMGAWMPGRGWGVGLRRGGVVWPGGVRKVRILGCFRTSASSSGLGAAGREESVVWSSERHLGAKCPRKTCLGGVCEQMRGMSSRDVEAMSLCR